MLTLLFETFMLVVMMVVGACQSGEGERREFVQAESEVPLRAYLGLLPSLGSPQLPLVHLIPSHSHAF